MTKEEFYELTRISRKDPIFGEKNLKAEQEQWKQINMPFILEKSAELNNPHKKGK